jgi:hypothetical protein
MSAFDPIADTTSLPQNSAMEAPFDLEGLVKDLEAFRHNVSFYLTDEPPLPPDVAEPLWRAHDTVILVLESLRRQYAAKLRP